jgi:iron(III) transport system substrate-binding protein
MMHTMLKKLIVGACVVAVSMIGIGNSAFAVDLIVYTAVEAEDLPRYAAKFNEDHPDIKIKWVRDSTGIMTAKLLAEKNNPQADLVWGLSGSSLLIFKSEGMLEPYEPKGIENLDSKFYDKDPVPSWIGMDAYVAAITYNTVEGKKNNLVAPKSWWDLTKPMYKGHVIMPNPNSSGTGFLDVSSWLQLFGEKGGWAFMDLLHENIARYTHSGSKPAKLAAAGEIPIGISFAFRGARSKEAGAPLEIIIPKEGIGWEMEASAIIAGTDKLAAAKTLMDWSITKKAMVMYNTAYAVVGYKGVAKPVKHFPPETLSQMIENDFEFAANNRKRILAEWQKRYDSKSDPKKK